MVMVAILIKQWRRVINMIVVYKKLEDLRKEEVGVRNQKYYSI